VFAPTVPARAPRHPTGDCPMQWNTPTAIDFRFGFEITMYVANR
jgi:coenzyme PQQ precursor peptide PqqA